MTLDGWSEQHGETTRERRRLDGVVPAPGYTLDLRGRIIELNLAGAALIGRDRASLIGEPLAIALDATEPAALSLQLRRCGDLGEPVAGEFQLRAAGAVLDLHAVSVPVRDRGAVVAIRIGW
jgi:PAS domain S-box-containing protein